MKNLNTTTRFTTCQTFAGGVLALAILATVPTMRAGNVSMNAGDAAGAASFNTAGHWDSLAAPTAGNAYFNAGFILRTPADAVSSYTFAGDSLMITSGNATLGGDLNASLMFKGTLAGTTTITVNNLTINGGNLRNGSGDTSIFTLAGNGLTVGSLGMGVHIQGPTYIAAPVSGSGEIRILDNGAVTAGRTLHFASALNTYNGNINLVTASRSRFALDNAANLNFVVGANGVNNKIFGAGVATLDGIFNIDLSSASTLIGDAWTLVDNSTVVETFSSTFSVSGFTDMGGNLWQTSANGAAYQFSELTGVLTVVPEPSTLVLCGVGLAGVLAMVRRKK